MKKYLFFTLVITLFGIACSKKSEDTKSTSTHSDDSLKSVPTPDVKSPQEDTRGIAPMDKKIEESQSPEGTTTHSEPVMEIPTSDDATPVKNLDVPAAGRKPKSAGGQTKTDVFRSPPAPATPPILGPTQPQPRKKAVGFHQMDEEEPTQE